MIFPVLIVCAFFAHTGYSAELCHSMAQMGRGGIDLIVRAENTLLS